MPRKWLICLCRARASKLETTAGKLYFSSPTQAQILFSFVPRQFKILLLLYCRHEYIFSLSKAAVHMFTSGVQLFFLFFFFFPFNLGAKLLQNHQAPDGLEESEEKAAAPELPVLHVHPGICV